MSFIKQCYMIMSRAFRKKPLMYILIVTAQFVSILCIFFAFGLVVNAFTSFENADESERSIYLDLSGMYDESITVNEEAERAMPYDEFEKNIGEITDIIGDNLHDMTVHSWMELDGKYIRVSSYYYEKTKYENFDIMPAKNLFPGKTVGDTVAIYGKEYTIVSFNEVTQLAFGIGEDTPSEARMTDFYFDMKEPLTYDVYKKVKDKLMLLFPGYDMDLPKTPELLDIQMNNTQIVMSAVLMIIVVLNCSLCYAFIYESRKKTFAIYRICGAREDDCLLICLAEVIFYMLLSFAGAFLMFDGLLKKVVISFYPKAALAYTSVNYLYIFIGYVIVTMAVMGICIINFVRKPIVEERK